MSETGPNNRRPVGLKTLFQIVRVLIEGGTVVYNARVVDGILIETSPAHINGVIVIRSNLELMVPNSVPEDWTTGG